MLNNKSNPGIKSFALETKLFSFNAEFSFGVKI